ncbi:MAG: ATP-grasp domain-containing protein [Clostridiales bacterium]|nr:ATP-grasp domain-containing protein [Clostridiales bacterium]
MKKILLLGGSAQQVIAIETAKRLGFYTVLCDYLTDNPGQYAADRFYLVSTTDKEAVLKVAEKEKIDGVLAYASDPAAPTAAYVAEKLGLPGNPYESVQILCNKDKFRRFLQENGFCAPVSNGYAAQQEIEKDICRYRLPVIVKPVDSSGSKGATVLHSWDGLSQAAEFAFSFSRTHRLIVEEYIEKKHKYLIGGDIFVYEGKVIQWGLMNCHRDNRVNPLVPVGKSYPLLLSEVDTEHVKDTLQRMVDKLGIVSGPMNVELVVDQNDRVWPIDIGPRSGGNMIPDLLGMIFDTDVVEMSVRVAMGMPIDIQETKGTLYYATHNLHTAENGAFEGIEYSEELKEHIVKECVYKKPGDPVEYFDNAAKAIGIIFLKFKNQEEMDFMLENINQSIDVKIVQGGGTAPSYR